MGGIFGRKKQSQFNPYDPSYNDPFYQGPPPPGGYPVPPGGYPMPPPYPYPPGYDPYGGGLGEYDPYGYGYSYEPTDVFESYYGGPMRRGPYSGGRCGRGMSPWNYGNCYIGNTTMQMIPLMERKLAKYALKQGMGGGGCMPMMPMMPVMPCLPASCSMPCLPASFSMSMAAPMIAAATPLPIAFNPLVQGMYPMTSMCPFNLMTPSSFMSALTTGPMAYRPPASLQFPSNISMVMPIPCGTPNPLLTTPSFGGFCPQYNFGGGLSCCCSYCTPSVLPPPVCYYPRPVSVPQPCPVPYPAPVAIPNIQQVPVPRPVSVVAPPIVAGCNPGLGVPTGAPLFPFQGGFTQGGLGQTLVMASNKNSTADTLLSDKTSEKSIHKTIDQSRRAKAQQIAASLSNLGLNNSLPTKSSSNKSKHRIKSNRKHISNSDWLTSDTLSSLLKHSESDHNCVMCKHEKHLKKLS